MYMREENTCHYCILTNFPNMFPNNDKNSNYALIKLAASVTSIFHILVNVREFSYLVNLREFSYLVNVREFSYF